MNIRKQTSRHQTASRAARRMNIRVPNLGEAVMPFGTRGNMVMNIIYLGLAVSVWHISDLGYAGQTTPTAETSSRDDRSSDHVVTGTLDQLDFKTGKGLLKTDLGKPIFFDIVQPELFRGLSVGQHVTIGVNEQGQAVKVMEIPPVELPAPPVK